MVADAKPWRNHYLHHQRSYPIKKKKHFDHISDSVADDYRLRTKMQRGKHLVAFFLFVVRFCNSNKKYFAGSRAVSSIKGQGASFVSSDSHGNKGVSFEIFCWLYLFMRMKKLTCIFAVIFVSQ